MLAVALAGASVASAQDRVYWSGTGGTPVNTVQRALLNGTSQQTVWPGPAQDIALDTTNQTSSQQIYWINNTGQVFKGNSDGTGASSFVFQALPAAAGIKKIALDGGTNTMFWVDVTTGGLYSLAMPSGTPTLLATIVQGIAVRDVALDLRSGSQHVYVSMGDRIFRCSLNGTGATMFPPMGAVDVSGIAVDPCHDMLFMIGMTTPHPGAPDSFIAKAPLATMNPSPVLTGWASISYFTQEIALDLGRGDMYWTTDPGGGINATLGKAGMTGASPQFIVTGPANGQMRGLSVNSTVPGCYEPPCRTIQLLSGQVNGVPGNPGQVDSVVHRHPTTVPVGQISPVAFTPAWFAAADSGPSAFVTSPNPGWHTLDCDPTAMARWISHTYPSQSNGRSCFYSVPFTVDVSCIQSAELDLCWLADDRLGDIAGGPNPWGVYVNGVALPITGGGIGVPSTALSVPLTNLNPGLNHIYFYTRNSGTADSGLDFNATIRITCCSNPQPAIAPCTTRPRAWSRGSPSKRPPDLPPTTSKSRTSTACSAAAPTSTPPARSAGRSALTRARSRSRTTACSTSTTT